MNLAQELLSITIRNGKARSNIQIQGSDDAIRAICSEAVVLNKGQQFLAPMQGFTHTQRSYIAENLRHKGFDVRINSNNSLTLRW